MYIPYIPFLSDYTFAFTFTSNPINPIALNELQRWTAQISCLR